MKAYIEFLRYSLDDRILLPESAKDINWTVFMLWAEQQAIAGIIFRGIERARKALNLSFDTLMEWVGYAQQVEMQNTLVNNRCCELVEQLWKDG